MWLFTLFDLPVDTPLARRNYAQFRKFLLKNGFAKIQFSVYARVCPSEAAMETHVRRIEAHIPPDGEVRLIWITDQQFARQRIFWGKQRKQPGKPPAQLQFF